MAATATCPLFAEKWRHLFHIHPHSPKLREEHRAVLLQILITEATRKATVSNPNVTTFDMTQRCKAAWIAAVTGQTRTGNRGKVTGQQLTNAPDTSSQPTATSTRNAFFADVRQLPAVAQNNQTLHRIQDSRDQTVTGNHCPRTQQILLDPPPSNACGLKVYGVALPMNQKVDHKLSTGPF